MKKITIMVTGVILLSFFCFCRKNKSVDLNPCVNAANDVILSVSSYTAVFNLLIKARLDVSLAKNDTALIDGSVVTYDSLKMKYNFFFGGAISPDSVRRSGNIAVVVSGDILQKGSYARVYFQDYSEDGGPVGGNDSISNQGVNALSQMVFTENISFGIINKPVDGGVINVTLAGKYKTNVSSLEPGNDIVFLAQGNISGVSSKGHAFSASIRDTLVDAFSCPWIKDGIIDLYVADGGVPDGSIDFVTVDGCSDVIWYYFGNSSFKVKKNKFYLKN